MKKPTTPSRVSPENPEPHNVSRNGNGNGQLDALRTFAEFGSEISNIAFPGIAARFQQPKGLLSELEWSDDFSHVAASVGSSDGLDFYEVEAAVHFGAWPLSERKGLDLSEFWTTATWRGFGHCSCPFADSSERICKHLGALVETAGSVAMAKAEQLELEASIPLPAPEPTNISAPPSRKPQFRI